MTPTERRLLIWRGVMLLRTTTLTPAEADEIDQLIVTARSDLPPIRPPAPAIDYAEASMRYAERSQRRVEIAANIIANAMSLLIAASILGALQAILYRPFSLEWLIHLGFQLLIVGIYIILYWGWGKFHLSSRDRADDFVKRSVGALYRPIRNILVHRR